MVSKFKDSDRLADYHEVLIPYNLQLFAESSGEKTEQPTAKRKQTAREDGQVAKSVEVTTALLLIVIFSVIKYYGPNIIRRVIRLFDEIYSLFGVKDFNLPYAVKILNYVIQEMLYMLLPIVLTAFGVALIANFVQVGFHPTLKPMKPKFSKFNPIEGFKRIFSAKSLIELLKAIMKIVAISVIIYMSVKDYDLLLITIYNQTVLEAYQTIANICLDIGIRVGAFFVVIAIADFVYQKYSLNKKLKMTKQEVKEEFKQAEGNPEVKSKIRQKMREAAMRRMMQELPSADVIITNPTHFAVAIKYDPNSMDMAAPKVIAKGADLLAARIKEVARDNEIEIVENRYLARTLYYTVEIGDEIPPELYQAVAEILAFVYSVNSNQYSSEQGQSVV